MKGAVVDTSPRQQSRVEGGEIFAGGDFFRLEKEGVGEGPAGVVVITRPAVEDGIEERHTVVVHGVLLNRCFSLFRRNHIAQNGEGDAEVVLAAIDIAVGCFDVNEASIRKQEGAAEFFPQDFGFIGP
ncbi:MAG: hypothetical protein DRH79_06655 [Candidatus Cloacimonadota bacterium]|nr:MAG: hypothetical protein DRH79_06655 [Candidatus Cloacimonadota bacterium]